MGFPMSDQKRLKSFRVLMVAPSLGVYGGIEAYTCRVAQQVQACGGFEVRVVFRMRCGTRPDERMVAGLAHFGIPWRWMSRPDVQFLRDLLWADLVNPHFPLPYAILPARLLCKPLAVIVENQYSSENHRGWHLRGLAAADRRYFISRFVEQTWAAADPRCAGRVVPAVAELPREWVDPGRRRGFTFIARWVPRKGLEELVEAYAKARIDRDRHPLRLLGDGPLRPEIEARIARLGLDAQVQRPGFVAADEKLRQMAGSRWNVAPSVFAEDLGLTPIEARACGVPSIVTRTGGLPEAAGERALYCEPGDPDSLAAALERAAAMDEAAYADLSRWAAASLDDYLCADDFFPREFADLIERRRGRRAAIHP